MYAFKVCERKTSGLVEVIIPQPWGGGGGGGGRSGSAHGPGKMLKNRIHH